MNSLRRRLFAYSVIKSIYGSSLNDTSLFPRVKFPPIKLTDSTTQNDIHLIRICMYLVLQNRKIKGAYVCLKKDDIDKIQNLVKLKVLLLRVSIALKLLKNTVPKTIKS